MLTHPVPFFCWRTVHQSSSAERLEAQDCDLVSSPPGGSVCRGTPGLAGGRAPGPSPGVAYLSPPDPPCQPQRDGGMWAFWGEVLTGELERLIKLVKENAIIEASSLHIPPGKNLI